MRPDISVIIPTYNRSELLLQAISSCGTSAADLRLEIIVIDDASTENIAGAVSQMGVLYERVATNGGANAARNRGLALASGEFVKFLDSDDVLMEGALRREFDTALRDCADIVAAGWQVTSLDDAGHEVLLKSYEAPAFSSVLDDLLAGKAVPTGAALYRGALAAQIGWDPTLPTLDDWDYFVAAALRAKKISSIQATSYRMRQHRGARITTSTSFASNAKAFYMILGKIEAELVARGEYTPQRRRRMAQYLYKELRGMYRNDAAAGRRMLVKLFELDPQFIPRDEERSALLRLMYRFLPASWILSAYGFVKRGRGPAHQRRSHQST
jgi:glycosyltransferase involved in cell wall biosynthesis